MGSWVVKDERKLIGLTRKPIFTNEFSHLNVVFFKFPSLKQRLNVNKDIVKRSKSKTVYFLVDHKKIYVCGCLYE